jgi:DMSO/TMAO reductase YedYZ heme-binding membrane subunit
MNAARLSPARWLAAPAVAALFALGVWVAGGQITDSFKAAMALTAAWVAAFGAACLAVAVKRRAQGQQVRPAVRAAARHRPPPLHHGGDLVPGVQRRLREGALAPA